MAKGMTAKNCSRKENLEPEKANIEDPTDKNDKRDTWSHPVDFLLSLIGYTCGLGNIWRFPYLCMKNGGGAFLIPYFSFLFLTGVPLFYLEATIGQFSSLGIPHVWKICPLFSGVGWSSLVVTSIMALYYNVIIAWIGYYLVRSFTSQLPWGTCGNDWNTENCEERYTNQSASSQNLSNYAVNISYSNSSAKIARPSEEFWHYEVLKISPGIEHPGAPQWELVLSFLISWIVVFLCLCKGVKSLGKVVYVTATAPFLFIFMLLIRGLTLDGAVDGIMYYLVPEWNQLLQLKVWGEACIQIFYTLGSAFGSIVTMGSYNKFKNNSLRDTLIICITCCGLSFLAGLVTFSVLGFMAKQANVSVADVITSGPGLAFIAYPEALNMMPFSPLWAVFFFLMLFTIGLDSQFGMVETMVAAVIDTFPQYLQTRKMFVSAGISFLWFLIGIPFTCAGGIYIFQLVDWYACSISLLVITLFEIFCFCHLYGYKRLKYDMELMYGEQPRKFFIACWFVITPLLILCMLIFSMFNMSEPMYGDYTYPRWAIGLGWIIAVFSIVPIPLVAIFKVCREKGSLLKRLKTLLKPDRSWGPALDEYKKGYKYNQGVIELENVENKSLTKEDEQNIQLKDSTNSALASDGVL